MCNACWRVSYTYPDVYVWPDPSTYGRYAWHKLPYTYQLSKYSKVEYTIRESGTADLLRYERNLSPCNRYSHVARLCTNPSTSNPGITVNWYRRADEESPWVLYLTEKYCYQFELIWRCSTRSLTLGIWVARRIIPLNGDPAYWWTEAWYEDYHPVHGLGVLAARLPETGNDCAAFDGMEFTTSPIEPRLPEPYVNTWEIWHTGGGTVKLTQIPCTDCPDLSSSSSSSSLSSSSSPSSEPSSSSSGPEPSSGGSEPPSSGSESLSSSAASSASSSSSSASGSDSSPSSESSSSCEIGVPKCYLIVIVWCPVGRECYELYREVVESSECPPLGTQAEDEYTTDGHGNQVYVGTVYTTVTPAGDPPCN